MKMAFPFLNDTGILKTKQKQAEEQTEAEKSQAAAAVRKQENAEREAKAEESKQTQMLTEDYIREHPDSLMAKIWEKSGKRKVERGKRYDERE